MPFWETAGLYGPVRVRRWLYAGLSKNCKEGRSGISSTLRELEECGYLVRERRRDEKGLLRDNIYVIYERPQKKDLHPEAENPALDNPALEKPALDKPVLENRAQLNTDLTNTDQLNTESNKRKREKEPRHVYFLELLIENKAVSADDLLNKRVDVRSSIYYTRVQQFASSELKSIVAQIPLQIEKDIRRENYLAVVWRRK
ncbi:MAG: hypothetical protein LUE87_12805 [Lachnospiraceae bacterium]|nr:hypothetical protein [Lachnospiraceae bacterium]